LGNRVATVIFKSLIHREGTTASSKLNTSAIGEVTNPRVSIARDEHSQERTHKPV